MKKGVLLYVLLVLLVPLTYPGCSDDIDPDPYGIQIDTDGDGVADVSDRCPETPAGAETDDYGCPVGSQYTYVPDDVFEQILIDQGFDSHLDDFVLTHEIQGLEQLELQAGEGLNPYDTIRDLTGIAAFESLKSLTITRANLMDFPLELSKNRRLTELNISFSKIGALNLRELEYLGSFNASLVRFYDLNAILKSGTDLQQVTLIDPMTPDGPLDYLDLSANQNLTSAGIISCFVNGPGTINLRNGNNHTMVALRLEVQYGLCLNMDPEPWEPCIEADDPAYVEGIIQIPEWSNLEYTVTTNCGG